MMQTFHRVILKKCNTGGHHVELPRFLRKEFQLSPEKVAHILRHPPAVLGDFNSKENVEVARKYLFNLDVECDVIPVIKDKRIPFAIDPRQLKWISKEFSKTLRAGVETSLFYVTVEPVREGFFLPSLLGKQEEIENMFRFSDSVFVIDDTTFVLLGFATDRDSCNVVFKKIVYCMEKHIQKNISVRIGFAVIPDDGKSFYELMAIAQKNPVSHRKSINDGEKKRETISPRNDPPRQTNGSLSDFQQLTLCFNKAKGEFYNELTALPPDVLWGALSRISISDQKKFFLQLPYDSHLTSYLAEQMKKQSPPKDVDTAKRIVHRMISRMQLAERLKGRQVNMEKVGLHLNRVESIFTLPSVAMQAYSVASDPDSTLDDIVEKIVLTPALTIKILKIVNSPFYGLSNKISSIKDAVVLMGTEEVVNMAFGLSLSESFLNADLKGLKDPKALWRHSMGTALIAKYLCRDLPQFKDMGIFTAGLLHDLGKVYLIENFSQLYTTILARAAESAVPISAIEQEILGMDHGKIGKSIGENWNLPDPLVHAAAFHHQPSAAGEYSLFAAMIGFSDYLSNMVALKNDPDANEQAMKKLNQQFKVDHMIAMKKLFPNFNTQFIKHSLADVIEILEENAHLLDIAD
ncbi:HDOD domain-containing protein [Desulfobacter curvatus]|uniref:HDOD domain-containing protein n=1 Tax=Desulfobacter curvatus TaxID=2290 RepID=UPI00037BEB47|nr:HDOD domain-containing protein [Desulfobacter curvatus]